MTKLVEGIPSSFARLPQCRMSMLRVLLATGATVAFLASLATPAEAQRRYRYVSPYYGFTDMFGTRAPRRATRSTVPSRKTEPQKDVGFGELPKGPLQIVVSIGSQRVTLFANGERVAEGPVSTGVPGHPTPLGVFSVIEKDRHHHSNIYSGAPMPFMQRITWSGIALHEGALPGHPASHGCIRLSYEFARKLWPTTKLGARVIVARTELAPADFAHAKLFAPRPKPAVDPVVQLDRPVRLAQNEGTTATDARPGEPDAAPAVAADEKRQIEAVKPAAAVETAAEPAAENVADTAAKPAEAAQSAETSVADKPVEATGAIDAPQPVAAPGVELRRAVEAPQPAEAQQPVVAAPASTEPEKPTPNLNDPPKPVTPRIKNADQPKKPTGQVAVFVSRKEKKIFIRQGFKPIFEMPITIDQPEHPLGTHVFTAMGATDEGNGMRWNLITVPNDVSRAAEPTRNSRRRGQAPAVAPTPVSHRAPSTAAEALDRIQFPQEAVDLIAERLIPGSSLVVSDEGLGRETGRGTDFIVLTR
ncbi:MAG: L,D-transpeptidase family protein [Xanthobacteraceae bacterium]